jgi:phosphocarrier protein HPr
MLRVQRTFEVRNPLGLHARAAAHLVKAANRYRCDVLLEKDGTEVNGKSIMGVLMLAATQGSGVTVRCEGDDANEAVEEISRLFETGFGEM